MQAAEAITATASAPCS